MTPSTHPAGETTATTDALAGTTSSIQSNLEQDDNNKDGPGASDEAVGSVGISDLTGGEADMMKEEDVDGADSKRASAIKKAGAWEEVWR